MISVAVVGKIPQTPVDDPLNRQSRAWAADELVTVGACVQLVMTMVGLVGTGMKVVDGIHEEGSQEFSLMSRNVAHPECEVKTLVLTDHTAVHVHSSGLNQNWSVFLGSLSTGRRKKAAVCCPCS